MKFIRLNNGSLLNLDIVISISFCVDSCSKPEDSQIIEYEIYNNTWYEYFSSHAEAEQRLNELSSIVGQFWRDY